MTLRVLIVEDEALIAMDIENVVQQAGHEVVGIASRVSDARALTPLMPDLAFVDLNLKDGLTGRHIAADLVRKHDVTVIFVTANIDQIQFDLCGALGVLPKPFSTEAMTEVIDFAAAIRDQDSHAEIPHCLLTPNSGPLWRQLR